MNSHAERGNYKSLALDTRFPAGMTAPSYLCITTRACRRVAGFWYAHQTGGRVVFMIKDVLKDFR